MLRQKQSFLTQIYAVVDFIIIELLYMISYWLKFKSDWIAHQASIAFSTYLIWGITYGVLSIMTGVLLGFYSSKRKKRYSDDLLKIIQIHLISMLALLSILFVVKEIHISRSFLVIFLTGVTFSLAVYRYLVKYSLKKMREKGFNKQFILVVGAGHLGKRFYDNVLQHPEMGFEVIGFLDDFQKDHGAEYNHYKPILGTTDDLENVLNQKMIDEVIIALPLNAHHKYGQIINVCEKMGVKTLIIPDFFDYLPARPHFDNFAGIPLINVRDIPLDDLANRFFKRTFDIIFTSLAIVITLPLMVLIVIGIKLTSRGPVIFKQERVGFNRRTFHIYKFRTMKLQDIEASDTYWTVKDDPRVTRFGSFLRKTSLDELPQFFNVLIGNMSVVGPRPERQHYVEQFKEEIPKYMIKHHIRPGITGWAQTNGLRGDTSITDRITYDIFYIENWTFILDVKIIWKTIIKGLVNRNAY